MATRISVPGVALPALSNPVWLPLSVIGAIVVTRGLTFGNPLIHVDEQFYLVTAHYMDMGVTPYAQIWDRKPVGIFLLYQLFSSFGDASVYAYQIGAALSVFATALMVAHMAALAGWRAGRIPAAVTYVLFLSLAEGQGGQTPIFYNLLMAGAALATLKAGDPRTGANGRWTLGFVAMALAGLSLQIKYSVVIEGMAFGLALLWFEWRARRNLVMVALFALLLVALALVPTIEAARRFADAGHWEIYYYSNFESIFQRGTLKIGRLIGNFLGLMLVLAPLMVLAALKVGPAPADAATRHAARFIQLWFVVALVSVILFGTWFSHYALPVMLPGAICAARAFALHAHGQRIALVTVGVAGLIGFFTVKEQIDKRGDLADLNRIAKVVGTGPECIWDYTNSAMVYWVTGRCSPSRYMFSSHIRLPRETGAIGVDQVAELRPIFAARPKFIVMGAESDEVPAVRETLRRTLLAHYRVVDYMLMGRRMVHIWRLDPRIRAGGAETAVLPALRNDGEPTARLLGTDQQGEAGAALQVARNPSPHRS